MATIEIKVCDLQPRHGEPVSEYVISVDGRITRLDLCLEHAQPLINLVETAARPIEDAVRSSQSPRRVDRKHIRTLEEIEELKRSRG